MLNLNVYRLTILVLFVSLFVCASGSLAYLGEPYHVPQRSGPVTIDGQLDDWTGVPGVNINTAEQVAIWHGNELTSPPADYSPGDLSATFWIQWDAENLYVAIKVTDDNLLQPDHSPDTGTNWWHDDEVEMSFDLGYNGGGTSHGDDDAMLTFTYNTRHVYGNWDYRDSGGWKEHTDEFEGAFAHKIIDEHTYVLEVRIPFVQIDSTFLPDIGTQIGFDISPEDEDVSGAGRDGQMFWVHKDANAWTDVSQWGTLVFEGPLSTVVSPKTWGKVKSQ